MGFVGHLSSNLFTTSLYSEKFSTSHASPLLRPGEWLVYVVNELEMTYAEGGTCIFNV